MTTYLTITDHRTVGIANTVRIADGPDDYIDEPGGTFEHVVAVPTNVSVRDAMHGLEATLPDGRSGPIIVDDDLTLKITGPTHGQLWTLEAVPA